MDTQVDISEKFSSFNLILIGNLFFCKSHLGQNNSTCFNTPSFYKDNEGVLKQCIISSEEKNCIIRLIKIYHIKRLKEANRILSFTKKLIGNIIVPIVKIFWNHRGFDFRYRKK